jgi:uncharacterized protein YciI
MYVVLLTYMKPWSEVMRLAPAHRAYAATRYADGSYLMSGRKPDRSGGVILALARDRAALDEVLSGDPFWREQVARYDVVEFLPQMAAERFSDLIVQV